MVDQPKETTTNLVPLAHQQLMGINPAKTIESTNDKPVSFEAAKQSAEIREAACLIRGDQVAKLRSQLLAVWRSQRQFAASTQLGAAPFSLAVLKDIERSPSPYRAKVDTAIRLCERLAAGLSVSPTSIWHAVVASVDVDRGARSVALRGHWHLVVPFVTRTMHRAVASNTAHHRNCRFCVAHVQTPTGELHLCPYGIGVWTQTVPTEITAIAQYAIRRRTLYKALLAATYDADPIAQSFTRATEAAHVSVHRVPYVFSYFHAVTYPWRREALPVGLRLLSYPSLLLPRHIDAVLDPHDIALKEKQYFAAGHVAGDFIDFSIDGVMDGIASWPGIAFHRLDVGRALTDEEIQGHEVSLQVTWTLLHALRSPSAYLTIGRLRKRAWGDAREMFTALHAIGSTQDEASCRFVSAMLRTSRISSIYEEVSRRSTAVE